MKKQKLFLLTFFLIFSVCAIKAEKIEKIIAPIVERGQVSQFGPGGDGSYGFQYYDNKLDINLTQAEFGNLVLKMDVWIENFDTPGSVSFIEKAGFGQIELASDYSTSGKYITWQIKALDLKSGWNELSLDLTTGKMDPAIDLSKITFFRFCIAQIREKPEALQIRIKDVKIVDKSILVDPPVIEEENWNTDYLVSNVDYNMQGEVSAASKGFSIGKNFAASPIDASEHNPKQLYLSMDVELDNQVNPGDISYMAKAVGQIELTSSGGPDIEEIQWNVNSPDWKVGKNTYTLAFSNAGGTIDLTNINYLRIYIVNVPADYDGKLQMKVSNVKIVDLTNQTKLPTIFSDHMMFQQNKDINVWGYAEKGKDITVKFLKGETVIGSETVETSEEGKWITTFDGLPASYDKYKLIVSEGETVIQTVEDILIGEIWLSAGQSNMELKVSGTIDGNELMNSANNGNIRFFLEPTYPSSGSGNGKQPYVPEKDILGSYWGSGNSGTQVGKVSAVAYRMALDLQEELDIPVGILNTAVGGSVIESWIPREEIDNDPDMKKALERRGLYFDEEWWVESSNTMTTIFNQKVGPLAGYNIAGTIWYQGESNSGRAEIYHMELDLMKKGYERIFNFPDNDMPFIFSHVAPWPTNLTNPQFLGLLAESMYDGWAMSPNSMAMLPIYDLDHTYVGNVPIHPTNKTPVGKRFAIAAMNLVYDKTKEYTAPVYESMSIDGNKVTVKFAHVGDGLVGINGATDIHGFAICGEDGIYVNANAKIVSKNEVEVWNDLLLNPVNVTYAFATYNVMSNLANSVGIPAAPFRSERNPDGQTYFNPQDWIYADGDVWGVISGENATRVPTWKASRLSGSGVTVDLAFDETIKSEGKASAKVSYNIVNKVKVAAAPVITYATTVKQLSNFNVISVDVLNPDNIKKDLQLQLISGIKTYEASIDEYKIAEDLATSILLEKSTDFQTIRFYIKSLKDSRGNLVSNVESFLKSVSGIQFVVAHNYDNNGETAGTVYFDNVTFGMYYDAIPTSINNVEKDNSGISINAQKDTIIIESNPDDLIQRVDIVDMQGKIVRSKTGINKNNITFDVDIKNIAGGAIIKVQTEKNVKAEKIIL